MSGNILGSDRKTCTKMTLTLEDYRLHPDLDIFYISKFLSKVKQESLYSKVRVTGAFFGVLALRCQFKSNGRLTRAIKIIAQEQKWVQLSHRRVQAHPSELLKGTTLLASPLPRHLTEFVFPTLEGLGILQSLPHGTLTHCLVNEYGPGQGISPHEDGDIYHPLVVTVSLHSHCVFELISKKLPREVQFKVLQEPGSCLITSGKTYSEYLHGIEPVRVDEQLGPDTILNWQQLDPEYQKGRLERQTRISLTFRDVLKQKTILRHGARSG